MQKTDFNKSVYQKAKICLAEILKSAKKSADFIKFVKLLILLLICKIYIYFTYFSVYEIKKQTKIK